MATDSRSPRETGPGMPPAMPADSIDASVPRAIGNSARTASSSVAPHDCQIFEASLKSALMNCEV